MRVIGKRDLLTDLGAWSLLSCLPRPTQGVSLSNGQITPAEEFGLAPRRTRLTKTMDGGIALYGAKAIFNSVGCELRWSGNTQAIAEAGFTDLRAWLADIARLSGVPVIDGPAVLGPADAPWTYLPGLSDDNTHPNFAGAERVAPLARAALSQVMGLA